MNACLRIVALLLTTPAFAAPGLAFAQSPTPSAPVEVEHATSAEFAPVLWAPGGVHSRQDARVANELAGRVVSVAEVGERVRAGGVLARIDDAMLELRERENRTAIARIEAQLDYSRAHEQRLDELVARGGVSGAQLDEARSQRRMLEQELAGARVALERTRHELRQASVKAPFDGLVAERYVQAGEYLAMGQPVVRLVNTSALEVRAQAPVGLAERLVAGMPVTVRGDDLLAVHPLSAVVPVGDAASRQFEVRVRIDGSALAVGAPVQVALPASEPREVVAVPRDALVIRREGTYVVRVSDEGTAERVPVETGAVQDELVEVSGAVRAGDRLVVRGGERVQSGQALAIAVPPAVPATDVGGGQP